MRFSFLKICVPAMMTLAAFCVPETLASTTVDARGIYEMEIDDEISPREGLDRAYAEARNDALQKVVGIRVQNWETLVGDSEAGTGFSSLSLQTTRGIIKKFEVKNQGWKIVPHEGVPAGILRIFCEARVEVEKIDEKYDLEFLAEIRGARADYRDGERVKFKTIASKNAYLTVFLLNARLGGAKVFPNRTFRKNAMPAGEEIELPPVIFQKTKDGVAREQGVLMFVWTKKNIPFFAPADGVVTADEINQWLAKIPSDERFFRVFPFSVAGEGGAIR